jgi:EAL domain-containing protein (putative c-di-GMP-specific phosphodiesterase class I)
VGKPLVHGIRREEQQAVAVAAIGALAEKLDAWLIAEGVEQVDDLERLVELGVPLAQGYLLGEPDEVPAQVTPQMELRIRALQSADSERLAALARPVRVVRDEPEIVGRDDGRRG